MYMLTFILAGVLLLIPPSSANFSFQEQLPNGHNVLHPCKVNYRWPGVGHENPSGGGSNNVFGLDFKAAGYEWTETLCHQDSDGDGRTNGEELGDPDCNWSAERGIPPSRTVDITHPGVCEPVNSQLCQGRNDFVDCEVETYEDCDRIKKPEVKNFTIRFPPWSVPSSETNYYCMNFDLPSDQDYHIIAIEPVIVNRDVMHHIVLFGCRDSSGVDFAEPGPCGMTVKGGSCQETIGGWTMGAPGECFRDNIGVRIGKTSYKKALMQIHWNNPKKLQDYTDSSGLKLYYQPARDDVHDLMMLLVGQRLLNIPPGVYRLACLQVSSPTHLSTKGAYYVARHVQNKWECVLPTVPQPSLQSQHNYVYYALNHMHYLGRSEKMELFRNGVKVADLAKDDQYGYDSPVRHFHDPPIQILPGDEIRTTCVFNSLSSSRHLHYGDGTQDEMCLGFLVLYPKDAVPNDSTCISFGPVSNCELNSGTPKFDCNWAEFLANNVTTNEYYDRLKGSCSLNGVCTRQCSEVHNELSEHPCMRDPMVDFVTFMMQRSHEGLKFLRRFHSCGVHGHDDDSSKCRQEDCDC